jgi:ATP-dependent exoDNAse (exonuclease V) alpha subunit
MICDRSWIYTAISRGQSRTVLVGDGDLAERFCRVTKITQRKTFLKELIGIELFKREAMEEL